VEAYNMFLDGTRVTQEMRECLNKFGAGARTMAQFGDMSTAMRQIVESKTMPKDMEQTIASYYNTLSEKCGVAEVAVSIRSSGPVSHPGQYETYLNVKGTAELMEKIIRVWSSTFNTRSLVFRSRQGLSLENDPIGVAVLKMVNARCAGIAFTADPNTGDTSKIIIEANWGLGESVVGGKVTPDSYILDKESLEMREMRLGEKTSRVTLGQKGVVEVETPADESSVFCLSDEEAKRIGELSRIIEEHFGMPQDVEWAVDWDLPFPQNIVLLQTRPVVIGPQKSATEKILELLADFMVTESGKRAFLDHASNL